MPKSPIIKQGTPYVEGFASGRVVTLPVFKNVWQNALQEKQDTLFHKF